MTGVVTFWKQNEKGRTAGWGFAHCDEPDSNGESQRIFVHFSDIKSGGFRYLTEGDVISFGIEKADRGLESRQRRGHRELVIDLTFLQGNTGSALAEPWKGVS